MVRLKAISPLGHNRVPSIRKLDGDERCYNDRSQEYKKEVADIRTRFVELRNVHPEEGS